MSDQAYLELWDLTKSYPSPKGEAVIVKNVSFKFRKGEFVTVIGHSGCGKSTILMIVAGLSTVTSGGIVLAGKELNGPGPDRGVVFQAPSLLPWMTAFQNVMLGVDQVFYTAEARERALTAQELQEAWPVLSADERLEGLRVLPHAEAEDFLLPGR